MQPFPHPSPQTGVPREAGTGHISIKNQFSAAWSRCSFVLGLCPVPALPMPMVGLHPRKTTRFALSACQAQQRNSQDELIPGNTRGEAQVMLPGCGSSSDSTSAQAGTRCPDTASNALSFVLPAAPTAQHRSSKPFQGKPCPPSHSLPGWLNHHRALRMQNGFYPFSLVLREQSPRCLIRSRIWSCHK